ncbi:MAG TPA: hypothetical protein VMI75_07485 [Polyangiaceae bacterium]|nr:hypothetical protein [Polyangiaceae bacterium]
MKLPVFVSSSIVVSAATVSLVALVQRARADGPPPLPPEAYAACQSKSEGEACTVQLRDREIHGTCAPDRDGERLFCRPIDMPPPPAEGALGELLPPM